MLPSCEEGEDVPSASSLEMFFFAKCVARFHILGKAIFIKCKGVFEQHVIVTSFWLTSLTSILLKYNPISQNILSPETQTTRHHIVRFYPCLLDFIIRFYVAVRASLLAVSMLLLGAFHALAKRRS